MFWGIEVCDKNGHQMMKKTRQSTKNMGEMKKGWGKMSDMEGIHRESK